MNLWNAFNFTDKKANGNVYDIYSFKPIGPQPYEYTFSINQCGSYNSEADCFNREHSWPQSWFNSTPGPDSDLFHIYPTDGYVNGQRANYPYGNVSSASWTSMNGGKLGLCSNAGYGSTVFEPINEFKGDLARTYFYMTTRYYSEDSGWGSSGATNQSEILPWQMAVLFTWHHADPVSAKEIARNDSIYKFQLNRNPFIDHPDWADSAWLAASYINEKELRKKLSFSIFPNPAQESFSIVNHLEMESKINLNVIDISGKMILEKEILISDFEKINCAEWERGIYFISVSDGEYYSHLKFVKQ